MRSLMMMMIAPKHVGAVLMSILLFFSKQFSCVSVGKKKTLIIPSGTAVGGKKLVILIHLCVP
jgi:hypothetical protein